jgi:hypothetical protein
MKGEYPTSPDAKKIHAFHFVFLTFIQELQEKELMEKDIMDAETQIEFVSDFVMRHCIKSKRF